MFTTQDRKTNTPAKIIGLTGGSGAGKGAVGAIFARYGIPVVDTDAVYHELLQRDKQMTAELVARFGEKILSGTGVDRKKLSAAVFGDGQSQDLLHTLNAITHKYIMARTWEIVREHENAGARAVAIDAPQLFEAHIENDCDLLVAVIAEEKTRIDRIVRRDGIDRDAAKKRITAQKDDSFYRSHCHYTIENNEDLNALEEEVRRFLKQSEIGVSCD